jgi:Tol biopolymer transport system component
MRWLSTLGAMVVVALIATPATASTARIVTERDGNLVTVRPDGSDLRRLTERPGRETHPSWSPDRQAVAFVAMPNTIVVVGADGVGRRVVFRAPGRFDRVDAVAWSPDGSRIAFSTAKVGPRSTFFVTCGAVWIMGSDGSDPHRIVSRQYAVTGLTWSPSSHVLAASFEPLNGTSECRRGTPEGIVRFRDDGSRLRSLDAPMGTNPDWSPRGGRIAFRDRRNTCHACGELFTMRPDGTHQHRVVPAGPSPLGAGFPRWSPTGRRLALLASIADRYGLWTIRPDGSAPRRVIRKAYELDW